MQTSIATTPTTSDTTCLLCGKTYSFKQKQFIQQKLIQLNLNKISSDNICLDCIKQKELSHKNHYLKQICQCNKIYQASLKAYQQAKAVLTDKEHAFQIIKSQYEKTDKTVHYIEFFLHKEEHTIKPKKQSKRKTKKSLTKIERILAEMSPEQRRSLKEKINKL